MKGVIPIVDVKKARQILNAQIQFVSLVDEAANQRKFLIAKGKDGKAKFETGGKILKVNDERHYVTGIVYEPMVPDAHDDYMREDEIKKASYWYMRNAGTVDVQHSFVQQEGVSVVESYIAPCDMEIDSQPITKGTWVMTMEVTDPEVWSAIKKGDLTGFSMGGNGDLEEEDTEMQDVVEKKAEPQQDDRIGIVKALFQWLGVMKSETPLASGSASPEAKDAPAPVMKYGRKMNRANSERLRQMQRLLSEIDMGEEPEGGRDIEKGAKEMQKTANRVVLKSKTKRVMKTAIRKYARAMLRKEEVPVDEAVVAVEEEVLDAAEVAISDAVSEAVVSALDGVVSPELAQSLSDSIAPELTEAFIEAIDETIQEEAAGAVAAAINGETDAQITESLQKVAKQAADQAVAGYLQKSRGYSSQITKSGGGGSNRHYMSDVLGFK